LELYDYPAVYCASDSSAINAQKKYFRLFKAKIALLLLIAGIASITWDRIPSFGTLAATVLAILLVVSVVLSAIADMKKFDRIWFSSRAIAESVKKETWLFMMKVEPYDDALSDQEAENRFLERLDQILRRQPSISPEIVPYLKEGPLITQYMRQMRKKALEDRRARYIQNRIRDQKVWYTTKATWNKTQESRWFIITWALQVLAAIIAVIIISFRGFVINPVGIITTAAAGALSWVHAQSFRELSQSYSLIVQELSIHEERADKISTEKELAELVVDVERAISGEHTIWLARRLEPHRI